MIQRLFFSTNAALGKRALTVAALVLSIGGCGGGGGSAGGSGPGNATGVTGQTQPSPDGQIAAALGCAEMAGRNVPAANIGLSTGGAIVTSATAVGASDAGNDNGEYCRLLGKILPAAGTVAGTPDINFQLNLPSQWNGKTVHMGGGGYNGTVVTGVGPISFAPGATPLSQGYATFGSDSGHTGNTGTADFALNEAAIANFASEHIKKTKDTAFALITLRYAQAPRKSYFAGASTGGREGMTAAQRYAQDYDGIIANAPAINFTGIRLHGVKIGQASYAPGGFVQPAKQQLILNAAVDACDLDDGAPDRLVSHVDACRARSAAILSSLACISGNGEGSTCLSAAQMNTVRAVADDLVLPYPLAYGANRHQGYNILQGADFSGSLGLGSSATVQSPPTLATNGYLFSQGDSYLKYFIAKNATLNSLAFDLNNPGGFQPRLAEMSGIVGAMNPDLSAFRARGGKLIVLHGLADEVISPNPVIAYYKEQVAKSGQAAVDGFWKFYTVPGFGHGGGAFVPSWDAIGALDRWVSQGIAPGTLLGTDTALPARGRTRPLCLYPGYPRYQGAGDINAAASYACAAP